MTQVLNKPSKEILVDLINRTNGSNLAAANVTFTAPEVEIDQVGYNTSCKINLNAFPTAADALRIYYNRIDFGAMFGQRYVAFTNSSYNSTDDLIPLINSAFGLGLTTDDIEVENFTASPLPYNVTIRAKATSLVYKGQFSVQLVSGAVTDPTPNAESFNQTLGALFQDANGGLLIDGTLPDGNFAKDVSPENGTITALRARSSILGLIQSTGSPPNYDYSAIGATEKWFVDLAAKFDVAGLPNPLNSYYDVSLTFTRSGGGSFTLTLNANYELTNGALALPLSYVESNGQMIQTEIDMSVLGASPQWQAAFSGQTYNTAGAPIDRTFTIRLTANNKTDFADRHEVTIVAAV